MFLPRLLYSGEPELVLFFLPMAFLSNSISTLALFYSVSVLHFIYFTGAASRCFISHSFCSSLSFLLCCEKNIIRCFFFSLPQYSRLLFSYFPSFSYSRAHNGSCLLFSRVWWHVFLLQYSRGFMRRHNLVSGVHHMAVFYYLLAFLLPRFYLAVINVFSFFMFQNTKVRFSYSEPWVFPFFSSMSPFHYHVIECLVLLTFRKLNLFCFSHHGLRMFFFIIFSFYPWSPDVTFPSLFLSLFFSSIAVSNANVSNAKQCPGIAVRKQTA